MHHGTSSLSSQVTYTQPRFVSRPCFATTCSSNSRARSAVICSVMTSSRYSSSHADQHSILRRCAGLLDGRIRHWDSHSLLPTLAPSFFVAPFLSRVERGPQGDPPRAGSVLRALSIVENFRSSLRELDTVKRPAQRKLINTRALVGAQRRQRHAPRKKEAAGDAIRHIQRMVNVPI